MYNSVNPKKVVIGIHIQCDHFPYHIKFPDLSSEELNINNINWVPG